MVLFYEDTAKVGKKNGVHKFVDDKFVYQCKFDVKLSLIHIRYFILSNCGKFYPKTG